MGICLVSPKIQARSDHRHPAAFTLIELLVVVSVIALLIGILLPSLGRARASAMLLRDQASARSLMVGYLDHASENGDRLLVGYKAGLPARDEFGQPIALSQYSTAAATGRYPWRLAPYLDHQIQVLFPDTGALEKLRNLPRDDFIYHVSESPRFGLNATFLGGDANEYFGDPAATSLWGPTWIVRRLPDASRPSDLLVFAAANDDHEFVSVSTGERIDSRGFFRVRSPSFVERRWPTTPPGANPRFADYGQVDFGRLGIAPAAMLDGHVEGLNWEQMQDMRRWSDQATTADWTLPLPG